MPYETKPMKKQWLEVDGRMTPIILPQIWNHELQDWVVTSEQNPLPTQLYGSNVGERKVIERSIFDSRSDAVRSEEHTSELQSRGHLVCRLLLEKKKDRQAKRTNTE